MWKALLAISAMLLAVSGYLGWTNQKQLRSTETERVNAEAHHKTLENTLATTKEELQQAVAQAAALKDEAQKLQVELDTSLAAVSQNDLEVNRFTTQLDASKTELADARKLLTEIGDVQRIQEEMAATRSQVERAQIEVASAQQNISALRGQKERYDDIASELELLRKDQEEGRIRPEFQSTVKRAYNQWGFVVVHGGNDQGVVKRAQLDVSRRGQPICKLIVTSVEPQESVAEVIPGSMVPGQTIQEGDDVMKSANPIPQLGAPSAAPAAAAPANGDPGMAPADPSDDPFGGGMAPEMPAAPPSDDPFGGGMAPEAPAAPPSDDPFGGGGMAPAAPEAPAPAPSDDPFGAGGMAPETPASPEAPAAPSAPEADPFQ